MSASSVLSTYKRVNQVKQLRYLKDTWLPTFIEQYKQNNSSVQINKDIIYKFLKQFYFFTVDTDVSHIPPIYRKRVILTDDNREKKEDPKNMFDDVYEEFETLNDNTNDEWSTIDDEVEKAILLSLTIGRQISICIDIRVYKEYPKSSVYKDDFGQTYYLTEEQIKEVKELYDKITDPRYNQKIEYYKAMATDIVLLGKSI